jgi:hypothetical protein
MDMEGLAKLKLGTVAMEAISMKTITDNFTSYFEPLIPWVNRLRKMIIPRDRPQEQEDKSLYPRMKEIHWETCENLSLICCLFFKSMPHGVGFLSSQLSLTRVRTCRPVLPLV